MNYKLVLKLNGYILMFDAVFMIIPIICAVIYKESAGFAFLPAMAIMAVIGARFSISFKAEKQRPLCKRRLCDRCNSMDNNELYEQSAVFLFKRNSKSYRLLF